MLVQPDTPEQLKVSNDERFQAFECFYLILLQLHYLSSEESSGTFFFFLLFFKFQFRLTSNLSTHKHQFRKALT